MKRCFAFWRIPPAGVSFLSATCSESYWLPFSFVLSIFSWRISSIICYCECYSNYNTSMKTFALSVGTLGCGWGSAPNLLTPFVWLGCCCWGIVGLDSTCEGMTLMFCVVLDLEGIRLRGLLCSVPIYFPTPQWSRQFNVVGLFFLQCWAGLPLVILGLSRPEPNYKDKHVTTAARL